MAIPYPDLDLVRSRFQLLIRLKSDIFIPCNSDTSIFEAIWVADMEKIWLLKVSEPQGKQTFVVLQHNFPEEPFSFFITYGPLYPNEEG